MTSACRLYTACSSISTHIQTLLLRCQTQMWKSHAKHWTLRIWQYKLCNRLPSLSESVNTVCSTADLIRATLAVWPQHYFLLDPLFLCFPGVGGEEREKKATTHLLRCITQGWKMQFLNHLWPGFERGKKTRIISVSSLTRKPILCCDGWMSVWECMVLFVHLCVHDVSVLLYVNMWIMI